MTIPTLSPADALATGDSMRSLAKRFIDTVCEWRRRAVSRRDIMALDARELWDIGMTRVDVEREAGKPFWRE